MSGFEVVGVVLGAIPILLSAVEELKKVTIIFRKRQHVKHLATALLADKELLTQILISLLSNSGCKDIFLLKDDPVRYLKDNAIRDQVRDYLGKEAFAACNGLILQCHETVKRMATKIAGLVPTIQGPSNDLIRIIKENEDMKRKQLDLTRRFKLLFGVEELREVIKELDEAIKTLSELERRVSSNRKPLGLQISKSALNIAKSLRRAHESASNLYSAISHAWAGECHEGHETRLFLEERIPDSSRSANASLRFPLVFSTIPSEKKRVWHETVVKVLYDEEDGLKTENTVSQPPGAFHGVKFIVNGDECSRPQIDLVENICAMISPACRMDFVLTKQHKIGMMTAGGSGLPTSAPSAKRSLKELFPIHSGERRGDIIPLNFRMLLALRLASNLLQLLQTHWVPNGWSHEKVFFPVTTAAHQRSNLDIDPGRPFISTPFAKYITQLQPQPTLEAREALLELGILLLEIWYEETLEAHFSIEKRPTDYYECQSLAEKWLDDEKSDEMLYLYNKAANYCIRNMIGSKWQHAGWEDKELWNAVCGTIIEPLYKNYNDVMRSRWSIGGS